MDAPIILRICESCHDPAMATGGLRNVREVLMCARCCMIAAVVSQISYAAFKDSQEDKEFAECIAKFCVGAVRSLIADRSFTSGVVAMYGDN